MITETSKLSVYRYLLTLEVLFPGENPVKINNANINSILIDKDFDNNFFPIFCINLFFETDIYYKIMKNRNSVRFKVKLEKYVHPRDESTTSVFKYRKVIFNDIFVSFIKDNEPNIHKDIIDKAEKSTDGNVPYTGTEFDLFLFKESDMISSKKMINTVIQKGSMTDTLTYLLSKSGVKKVLMAPLDNINSYEEILLMPMPVIQNIIYLEKQYGFYKNGTVLFYDLDNIYLVPKSSTATAYKTGEFKTTILTYYKSDSALSSTSGSYEDKINKTNIIHINKDNISFNSTGLIDEQLTGSNISFVDTTNNEMTTVHPNVQNRNTKNTKVYVNNFSNEYLPTIIENHKSEEDNIISALIYDFDMDALSPNKKFVLSFQDTEIQKKYGGNYRITNTKLVMLKQGDAFDISGEIILKKPI